jgi:hypothetical protein
MPNGKQRNLVGEPAPDDAPPEELNGDVVNVPATVARSGVPDLADDEKLQNAIAVAERRFAFTEAVKKIALARTSPHHWAKYPRGEDGYVYYLTGDGATNLIKGFGVQVLNVRADKIWGEDELGRYYIWVYTGDAYIPVFDMHVEGIQGRCSQRKAFFAKAGKEWKPTSEIDEANIMADAHTDFFRNVIRRTIGIGYEAEETIAEAKIDTSKVAAPSFKKGGRSGSGIIKAKFKSTCAACGKTIAKGEEIYYDRAAKKAYHPECAPKDEEGEDGAEEADAATTTEEPPAPGADQQAKLITAITESTTALGMKQPDLEKFKRDVWGQAKKLDDATVEELDKLYSRLLDLENAAA